MGIYVKNNGLLIGSTDYVDEGTTNYTNYSNSSP